MSFRALVLIALAGLAAGTADQSLVRTFDEDHAGAAPSGFTFAEARGAASHLWTIERTSGHGVLVHRRSDQGQGFALAVLESVAYRSVEASVRTRLVGGTRTGGLVWHYRDEANYYLALLDLGAQDLALYRVERGHRIRLENQDDLELDPDAWHTLKVRHLGDRIQVYADGIKVLDDHARSRRHDGRVGLWSADDSVSWFDDLRVTEMDDSPHAAPPR
jgi:hypothetical protein